MHPWPAPHARGPVHATVAVPGSKSASNRALVLAALSDAPSRIIGLLDARDTRLMMNALRALGATITTTPGADPGNVDVEVRPLAPARRDVTLDAGLAGTVMRFVPALAGLTHGTITLDGDDEARVRPMAATVDALEQLGIAVTPTRTLPITIKASGRIPGGTVRIDASASSQFISALLLIGARTDHGLTIEHTGEMLPSRPHIEMTIAMLREHGVDVVQRQPHEWFIPAGPIVAIDRTIEPDLSNAAPFLAAALVTQGTIRVKHWPRSTTQAGDHLRDLLVLMGAKVEFDAGDLVVQMSSHIRGINADLRDVGELTPTIAALAALAESPSRLTGIGHLRGHETDRLAALVTEIRRIGGIADELPDGISIHPSLLHGGVMHTYADHRMATAGAVLGLHVHGLSVEDISATEKTLPDFPTRWANMLAGVNGA
jgi:3-phosphoshikimate 1-carboxyvinyltransferase